MHNRRLQDDYIWASSLVSIAPKSTKLVKVWANFTENTDHLFVEKRLATSGRPEEIYGCTHTLISKESPFVYVSNFSKKSVTIPAGQILSQGHDPSTWLNKEDHFMQVQWEGILAHANILQSIINLEGSSADKNPFAQMVESEIKIIYDTSWQDYLSEEVDTEK